MIKRLRILIADDSGVYRRILARAVREAAVVSGAAAHMEDVELMAAENGVEALKKLAVQSVDLCLLDLHMPVMDGMEALRYIRRTYINLPVIMISSLSPASARMTIQALGLGAVDFICKPEGSDFEQNMVSIRRLLSNLFVHILPSVSMQNGAATGQTASGKISRWAPDVLLIASSTGGPAALNRVIPSLQVTLPVLVVQHMPAGFTTMFAQSLNDKSQLAVAEGKENELVEPGRVLIAPGGYHMTVQKLPGRRIIQLKKTEPVCGVRPSADVLFTSAAQAYEGRRVLVVVLTGMGHDGTAGVEELKRHTDCRCLTQSEKTCVVYGMPRSVAEAGLSDETWDIDSIAGRIGQLVGPAA